MEFAGKAEKPKSPPPEDTKKRRPKIKDKSWPPKGMETKVPNPQGRK